MAPVESQDPLNGDLYITTNYLIVKYDYVQGVLNVIAGLIRGFVVVQLARVCLIYYLGYHGWLQTN